MGWEGGAEKVDILLIYCIRLQIKTCMYVCMYVDNFAAGILNGRVG